MLFTSHSDLITNILNKIMLSRMSVQNFYYQLHTLFRNNNVLLYYSEQDSNRLNYYLILDCVQTCLIFYCCQRQNYFYLI